MIKRTVDKNSRACSVHGKREMHIGFSWESKKKRDHQQDLVIGGKTTLKLIFEK
jgi:hypothetical protein